MQQTTVAPQRVVRVIEPTVSVRESVKTHCRVLRVAAYCRVSTKQEEQLNSYENQVQHYTERINSENGWTLEGIYADKGISGTSVKNRDEFNRMIRSIGRVPHSDNLMVTRETAMPELAAKLGLDPEREHTLVFVRRRVLADETPVLYSTDILPLALFGGKRLDTIDFSRPIFEIVEQHCHVEVTETLTTLHAVQGVPGIRRQLGLRPEQALLQLDEICYSRTCKPVLCCQTCYTDFFDFAMVRKLI